MGRESRTSRHGRVEPGDVAGRVRVSGQQALDGALGEGVQAVEGAVQRRVRRAAGVAPASGDLDPPDEIHQLQNTVTRRVTRRTKRAFLPMGGRTGSTGRSRTFSTAWPSASSSSVASTGNSSSSARRRACGPGSPHHRDRGARGVVVDVWGNVRAVGRGLGG